MFSQDRLNLTVMVITLNDETVRPELGRRVVQPGFLS